MDSSRDIVKKLREGRILNERKDYESMDRDELVRLAKDGDQLAFSTLINTHQEFFYKMTKKYIAEGVFERDDILQIAEIAFWEAVQGWNGSGDFEAYAGMIVKRRLVDEYRKQFTDKAIANRDTKSIEAAHDEDDDDYSSRGHLNKSEFDSWTSQQSRSAEDEYLDKDMEEQLVKFFKEEMTEVERKLIRMYLDGYKMSQIAEETGVKYKSCENAVRRAKEKLRSYLSNMKESKVLREGNVSIFSDEESKILKSVLSKIEESESINESEDDIDVKDLEDYTDDEFEDLLIGIKEELSSLIEEISTVSDEDRYSDILDEVSRLGDKILECEDILESDDTSYLFRLCKEAYAMVRRAKNTNPENIKRDPYAEVGMNRSDFF